MGNPNTCLKISPRQIQKIVFRAAEMQDRAPEFLDLLGMVVKVTGTDLTLKRNQAYVMKYIMQNYKKVAYVLDLPLEEKFVLLCMRKRYDSKFRDFEIYFLITLTIVKKNFGARKKNLVRGLRDYLLVSIIFCFNSVFHSPIYFRSIRKKTSCYEILYI